MTFAQRCAAEFGGVWVGYENPYSEAPHAFQLTTRTDRYGREVIAQYSPTRRVVLPEQAHWVTEVRAAFLDEECDALVDTSARPGDIPWLRPLADTCQFRYVGPVFES